jgi:hypothetical protein
MVVNQLTCPHCQTALKLNKTVPAGIDTLCPICKKIFKVTSPVKEKQPVPASTSFGNLSGGRLSAGRQPTPSTPGPEALLASQPRNWLATSAGRMTIVLGGGFLLLISGLFLALWSFSGNTPEAKGKTENPDDPSEIAFSKLKKLNSKKVPVSLVVLNETEQKQVDQIKKRGVDFLKKSQNPDGTWPGGIWERELAAMGGLTLLECGVPVSDPAVKKAAERVRESASNKGMIKTYGISLYILFLNKLNDPQDADLIKSLALQLVAGQTIQGGWGYDNAPLDLGEEEDLFFILQNLGNKSWDEFKAAHPKRVAFLPAKLKNVAIFNPAEKSKETPDFFKQGGDNSNTQFALLALWVARNQVPVEPVLHLVVKRFRESQEADGHWVYDLKHRDPQSPGDTMTCAGLLALAIGYGLEQPHSRLAAHPRQDPGIIKGLAHLGPKIGFPHDNPQTKPDPTGVYFLWSVERVGVLFQSAKIGGKDWYRWGLRILQAYQTPQGSWVFDPGTSVGFAEVPDTCFALLFLNQANLVQDLTDKLEEIGRREGGSPVLLPKKE